MVGTPDMLALQISTHIVQIAQSLYFILLSSVTYDDGLSSRTHHLKSYVADS